MSATAMLPQPLPAGDLIPPPTIHPGQLDFAEGCYLLIRRVEWEGENWLSLHATRSAGFEALSKVPAQASSDLSFVLMELRPETGEWSEVGKR